MTTPPSTLPSSSESSGTPPGDRDEVARARAQIAARDRFLGTAVHDLRSPLNAIMSWANVLQTQISAEGPPLMVRALTGIRQGVEQQARLIEELLDASRVLNGSIALQRSPVAVATAVQAAIASTQERAESGSVRVRIDMESTSMRIDGDAARIEQIARLLLLNGLGFAPRDSEIRIALQSVDAEIRLSVSDRGPGLVAASVPIFETTRAGDGVSGADGSLVLVRRLVELHAGRVWVTADGDGVTYWVAFPAT